ncbi:MAG: hypothetical protein COY80_04030 [Candidatus Pacebacteria bacterium CG_4_10_14_0_8_um_filter_42_14]|nr:MAG: hypothetical protein COY80_04030 [Candidatus Pacebacteria bacterium CG_4_10_14_0_8_um_filter_42_14]
MIQCFCMFPVIFSIGPFVLPTAVVCNILAFILALYTFWRKGREEHFEEHQIFDTFLLAVIAGFLAARIGYITFHFDAFGFSVIKWLDLGQAPGLIAEVGVLAAALVVLYLAAENKWDKFEALDFWTLAIVTGFPLVLLGMFFSGSGIGKATNMPWGVVFPGLVDPHHPVQLYALVFFVGLSYYLHWVESKYRTFVWYRASRTGAETGFLVGVGSLTTGVYFLLLSLVRPGQLVVGGLTLDWILFVALAIFGFVVLYLRSGRTLFKKHQSTPAHFNDTTV